MRSWQEVKESANYHRLKGSLELRAARYNTLVYTGCTLFCLLLVTAGAAMRADPSAMAMAAVMTLAFLSPFAIFYIYRMIRIFQHIDAYIFTEVILDKPHSGFNRMMYFSVELRDRSGAPIQADTHEIFHTHGMVDPLLEDYVNQKVLIGYNPETEFVAVIEKVS